MVNYSTHEASRLNRVFSALADPSRRAMLARLSRGEATVGQLAAPLRMTAPAVTKHLKVLERAGLIARTIEGRVHTCRLSPRAMAEAVAWIERQRRFWDQRLDALGAFLEHTTPKLKRRRGRGNTHRL